MAYRDYSTALGKIVDPNGLGDFTNITSALAAASSGQTIFVRPGTYTENFTLKTGVDIVAYTADAYTKNVTIVGEMSFSSAGTVSLSGICLQTNANFALAVTGAAASIINLKNCEVIASNNTAISFTSSNAAANINILNCSGNLATTGIAYFSHSSAGALILDDCNFTNTGSSTTASTISAGSLQVSNSTLYNGITSSGTGSVYIYKSQLGLSSINQTMLTIGGSGTPNRADHCSFYSGSSSAVSISSIFGLYECIVDSTNANSVTGSGTLLYTPIEFTNTGTTINTTTTTPVPIGPQIYASGISFNLGTTTLNAIPVPASEGGSGVNSPTAHGVLVGEGAAAFTSVGPSATAGALLGSGGGASDPAFITPTAGTGLAVTTNATTLQYALSTPVSAANGGSGVNSPTAHGVLVGEGAAAFTSVGPSATAGAILLSKGATADPGFVAPTAGSGLSITTNATTLTYGIAAPVSIANGGTNATSFATTNGVVKYNGTSLVPSSTFTINASNFVNNSSQPLVSAFLSTTTSNATGDGSAYIIPFNTVLVNNSASYNAGSGIFTAPVAGNYLVTGSVGVGNLSAANTAGIILIDFTARTFETCAMNYGAVRDINSNLVMTYSVVSPMAVGDQVFVAIEVSNGSKIVTALGSASPLTYLGIYLLS